MKTLLNSVYSDLSDVIHRIDVFYPNSTYRITFKIKKDIYTATYRNIESPDDLIVKFDDTCQEKGYDDIRVLKIERGIIKRH